MGSASGGDHGKPLSGCETKNLRDLRGGIGLQNRGRAEAIDFAGSKRSHIREYASGTDKVRETRGERGRKLAHAFPATDTGNGCSRVSPQPLPRGRTLPGLSRSAGLKTPR